MEFIQQFHGQLPSDFSRSHLRQTHFCGKVHQKSSEQIYEMHTKNS